MMYALKRIWEARKAEFESCGIELVAEQNLILTEDKAIKLDPFTSTMQIQRILRPLVQSAKDKQAAAAKSKQVNLFEEDK